MSGEWYERDRDSGDRLQEERGGVRGTRVRGTWYQGDSLRLIRKIFFSISSKSMMLKVKWLKVREGNITSSCFLKRTEISQSTSSRKKELLSIIIIIILLIIRNNTIGLEHIDKPAHMSDWPLFHNGVAAGIKLYPSGDSKVYSPILIILVLLFSAWYSWTQRG